MLLVGSAFLVAWTPYAIAAYVAQFGPKYIISPLVMTILRSYTVQLRLILFEIL